MASAVVGAVRVVLGLDSAAFVRGMSEAQRQLHNVGRDMQDVGRRMSLAVTAPIVGFGALTLRAAGNFEAAMNQVAAVSGATGDELQALSDQAKQLGATTQYTAAQAGDAMGFLAMAGMEAGDILAAMPDTLQLAAAAQLDMARAADIVTNILAGYNMEVGELGRATDVLVKAFTSANTDLSQLADAMRYAGPVAQAAGVQFEEATAAMALMGNAGIQASMAGTSLRGAISRMLNPTQSVQRTIAGLNLEAEEAALLMEAMEGATDDMASAMAQAGLNFTDASGRLLPLADIIEQLEPHADNAGLFMQLFGQRAGPAMAALVTQGSDAVRELTGELENSAGTAAEIAAVQMQGFNGAMRQLAAAFEALQLAIADAGLIQWATDITQALAEFLQGLSQTNPEMLRMGTVVAGLAAAIGPLLIVLGTMATAIAAVGWPITLVVIGIGALTAAVIAFWPEIQQLASVIGDFLQGAWAAFESAWDGMVAKVGEVKQAIMDFASQIPGFFSELPGQLLQLGIDGIQALWNGYQQQWVVVGIWLQGLGDQVVGFFADLPGRMLQVGVDIIHGLWNGLQQKWTETANWFGGIGDQITGFLTNPLGIHSPSTVMHQIGAWTMEGFNNGLQSYVGTIEDTVSSVATTIGNAFKGVLDGSKTVGQAIADLTIQLGQMFLSQGFQALAGMGGGWGFIGNLFSSLVGFARGGTIMPGGAGGIDSQLVMFRKSPNERVDITKPGQTLTAGEGPSRLNITTGVAVDGQGSITSYVKSVVRDGIEVFNDALPQRVQGIIADPRAR